MLGSSMRSRKHVLGLGLLLAAGVAVPAVPALAQPSAPGSPEYPVCTKPVSPDDSDKAHTKYLAGRVDYDQSQWDSAIINFVDAYKKDCTKHELLVIISRAYEQKQNYAEAIRALETYLARVKDAPDKSTYETRIQNLKRDLARQQATASSTPSNSATSAPTAAPTATQTSAAPPPAANGEVREHTVLPWVVVTVGGASLVTGIILLATAPPLPTNCNATSGTCVKQPANELDTQLQTDKDKAGQHVGWRTAGLITLIGGIGVIGGGLLWHFVEPTGPTTGKPSVTPQIGPGYAGASLGGTF